MTHAVYKMISLPLFTAVMASCSNPSQSAPDGAVGFDLLSDINVICKEVPKKYAYFEARAAHWPETCERARQEASRVESRKGALEVLERVVDDLYDPHIGLNTNNQNSPRLIPSGSDLWIETVEDKHIVTAVRPKSGAAEAGIRVGDALVSFNQMMPRDLALTRIHAGQDSMNENRQRWAINAAIAGRRSESRNIEIRRGEDVFSFSLAAPEVSLPDETVTSKIFSERVGYIRFNNSLGNSSTVSAFNLALNDMRQTDGLIIDLRETPSGGSTNVAEPILGRFIAKKTAYQRTVFRNGIFNNRAVKPSGEWTYDKPVIVLVGRWTGSMGEGMAIGFDGMKRGHVMGSKMARLAGGTKSIKLKKTGISLNFPAYDLHHLDGTPRHNWEPSDRAVADNGAQKDIVLERAISKLQGK
ncbi:MAG: S41 family peptidase [Hellea sp.]